MGASEKTLDSTSQKEEQPALPKDEVDITVSDSGSESTSSGSNNNDNNDMPRVKSKNTLLIEGAYTESSSINLVKETASNESPSDKVVAQVPRRPLLLPMTNVEAMNAANIEIQQVIQRQGRISAAQAATIMQNKMQVLHQLWKHFPGAISSAAALQGFQKVLQPRGYTPENTLFAQSICPDEVNHEPGDITDLFKQYCGEVFHLGGLAGIPFTGQVGFGAFSHHVPQAKDDANGSHCAILLAPHIGMDHEGKLGRYLREGQAQSGACCGAAVGAYLHCRACKPIPDLGADPELYQFNYIINQVSKNMDTIQKQGGTSDCAQQAALVHLMHQIGSEMLGQCVHTNFGGSGSDKNTLVVLTGIQINMPSPFCDFFLPLGFVITHKKDGTKEDVFEEAFGPRR